MKIPFLLAIFFLISTVARADFKDDYFSYSARGKVKALDDLINDKLDAGEIVDFSMTDFEGNTALMYAAWNSQVEIIRYLMQYRSKGLDLNVENFRHNTVLTYAISNNCLKCANILVSNQAEINNIGMYKQNALFFLLERVRYPSNDKETEDLAIHLVNNGADLSLKDENVHGETVLFKAIRWSFNDLAKLIVRKGMSINTQNNDGTSSLMLAAGRGNNFLVDYFLKNNADKTLVDNGGRGPLFYALDNLKTVKLLLQNEFDVTVKNNEGKDIFDIAAKNNYIATYDYLTSAFPNHNIAKETLDLVSAIKRYDESLKKFIKKTSQRTSTRLSWESMSSSELDYNYYRLTFARKHNCSPEETVDVEYILDFSKKMDTELFFDIRDVTVRRKIDYQINITSSIDFKYPGFKGVTLSFKSGTDRQLWIDEKDKLELLAAEIQKYVPLKSAYQPDVPVCH